MTVPRQTITGKIVSIDKDKRAMLVRSNDERPEEHPLKWKPVMDDVCRKEKPGNRVAIETATDGTDPQPYIMSVKFDETYKKNKPAYADPNGDLILLQSCLRTGATVLAYTTTPDQLDFDGTMDVLIDRAIKDAARLKSEAKKL